MSTLSNRSLDASYIELLKIDPTGGVNTGISASLANVETGNGTASALRLSTTQVHSTGTLTSAGLATLNSAAVTNNATIGGTLGVTGLLTATGGVSGALTGNVTGNVAGNVTGNVSGNLSGNVNGTIGATTPNSGSFTTLGASGSSTLSSVSATSLTVSGDASFTGSGAIKMPVGATAGATGRPVSPAQGMLRYNTSLNQFEGYDGSSWAPIASGSGGGGGGGQTMYVRQTFTATASQTTFTITGGYTAYKLDVFQNGVKLVNSDVGISRDVDVSNGTTIVLATGAAVGDVIDVIGLTSGNFAGPATARRQTYTATAGQTTFTVSGGYTVGQLDVFQNGTKLVTAVDVDVSNGSTFTLTTPAVAGDTIEVVGFTAADTVSGTLQFQAGTAAAPSITTFGDTNTGLFFPAADTIAFAEGGAEAMRIDSSGNVGVGTNNPSTPSGKCITIYDSNIPRLNLKNSTSGDTSTDGVELYLTGSDAYLNNRENGSISIGTNNATKLLIDSSGQVGIGTTSPSGPLHIRGAVGRFAFPATSGATQSNGLTLRLNDASDDNAILDIGGNSTSGYWLQATNNSNLAINYPLLLNPNGGNVGIGSTSPAYPLVVSSAVSTQIQIKAGNANGSSLLFGDTDSAAIGRIQYDHGTDSMAMWTNSAERLRITSSGDVLIGATDTSPSGGTVGFKFVYNTTNPFIGIVSDLSGNSTNYHLYNKNATNNGYRFFVNLNGGISNFSANNVNLSDERLKTNISPAGNYLEKICSIPVKTFNYKDQGEDTEKTIGIIAQDVEAVIPELINNDGFGETPEDGIPLKTIYQTDIQYVLMRCIQELSAKVTALEAA